MHEQHHQVRRPAVHVADDQAGRDDKLQILHDVVGLVRAGDVIEHEEHAGGAEDQEQVERNQSQPERVGGAQGMAMDLGRLDMEQKTGNHRLRRARGCFPADPRERSERPTRVRVNQCQSRLGKGAFIPRGICPPPPAGLCPPPAGCPCSKSRRTTPTGAERGRFSPRPGRQIRCHDTGNDTRWRRG